MGIARGAVALLLEEARRRPYSGRLLTLGRQTIYTTSAEVFRQFSIFDIQPHGIINLNQNEINDDLLFRWMGFDSVESLDYSDFEGATHLIDLNKDSLPNHMTEAYDVVIDSGTLEHVFNFPNALKNVSGMLKVGGRLILLSPSSNHLDHGFYMFSPTLFYDYFISNHFSIETIYLVRYSTNLDEMWDAYLYEPEAWRDLHIGGLDDRPYAIFAVVTRQADSTLDAIPQQGYYATHSANYANSRLASGQVILEDGSKTPPMIPGGASILVDREQRWKSMIKRLLGTKVLSCFRAITSVLLKKTTHGIFSKKLVGRY